MAKEILEATLGGEPVTADELAAIPDFKGIRKEIWDKFPGAIAKKTYRAGEVLMREGESGTTAFYLLSGSVDIFIANPVLKVKSSVRKRPKLWRGVTKITSYLKGIPPRAANGAPQRTEVPTDTGAGLPLDNAIATLDAGEMVGELAALAALKQERLKRPKFYPRSATVRARTDVVALEMLPNILNNVLYTSPAFKDRLNKNYRERALISHFLSVPAFRNLTPEFLTILRDRAELVDLQPGQTICRQGDVADAFYLIRLGFVKVSQDFAGGEFVVTYLSRGSYFGEMGLLPAALLVRAKGQTGQIAEGAISREPLLCGRAPSRRPSLTIPWDEYISRDHFDMTAEGDQVRVQRAPGGKNPITFRGQPADSILVRPGESFVAGNTTFEILADPQAGRRSATCTAMDFVQLVRIKAEDFAEILRQFPEFEAEIAEVARTRRQMNAQLANRVQTVSLNDFLEQELMQGQDLLLIDLTKCTRCDECVKACVATHEDGVTRLIRDGLRFDKYLTPTSCRACLDPVCMTRCPVGSIRRKQTLEIVIEDWCIGCGNCAIDCPYGNINVVQIMTSNGSKQKAEARPKAVVCDLCAEYAEPNCVRACPHDAALRVEPKSFFARELVGLQLAVPAKPATSASAPQAGPEAAPANIETRIFSNIDLQGLLPHLKILSGPGAGSALQLRIPATTFGRGAGNDYRFADDTQMSRAHCTIVNENGRYLLRDLGSTNGTQVNGDPILEVELRPGDVIEFGELRLEFQLGQTP